MTSPHKIRLNRGSGINQTKEKSIEVTHYFKKGSHIICCIYRCQAEVVSKEGDFYKVRVLLPNGEYDKETTDWSNKYLQLASNCNVCKDRLQCLVSGGME